MSAFARVFNPGAQVGKRSNMADLFNVGTDIQSAFKADEAEKTAELDRRWALAKAMFGDDYTKYPTELLVAYSDKYGTFKEPTKPLEMPRPPKQVERVKETKEMVQPPTPTPDPAQMRMERQGFGNRAALAEGIPTPAPKEVTKYETEYVPEEQAPVSLPTSVTKNIGGQDYYLPVDAAGSMTIGQLAEVTGAILPAGMNPDVPVSTYKAMGVDPLGLVQKPPSLADIKENLQILWAQVNDAMTKQRNPLVTLNAYRAYESAYKQGATAYGGQNMVGVPHTPMGEIKFMQDYEQSFSQMLYTPDEKIKMGEELSKGVLEHTLWLAGISSDAALSYLEGIEDSYGGSLGEMLPSLQLYDRKTYGPDGKVISVQPGLESLIAQYNQLAQMGRVAEAEQLKAQIMGNIVAQKKLSGMGTGGGGGGTRGGGGGGNGAGGDGTGNPNAEFGMLPSGMKFSDARQSTQYFVKAYDKDIKDLGPPPDKYAKPEDVANYNTRKKALQEEFAANLAHYSLPFGEINTYVALQDIIGPDAARKIIDAAKMKGAGNGKASATANTDNWSAADWDNFVENGG